MFTSAPRQRRWPALIAALLMAYAGPACLPPSLAESTDEDREFPTDYAAEDYGLGPHDEVLVTVLGHPELSTSSGGQRVDPQGILSLPLIGPVAVDRRMPEDVRSEIETRLAEWIRQPSVSLSVTKYGARRLYVLGHVSNPGAYTLDRPLTALQALSLGGRFESGADRNHIALVRRVGPQELLVHVFNAATPGLDGIVPIQPDDLLFVRQSGAGTFAEQAQPILSTWSSVFSAASSVVNTLHTLDYL